MRVEVVIALAVTLVLGIFLLQDQVQLPVRVQPAAQEFQLVTGEWSWKSADGTQEIEVYRWDPAMLIVKQGARVTLKIYGVKGERHTLAIEAFGVRADILRGRITTVSFVADKAGTFEILCLDHPDREHQGPMVGYLIVLP